MSPTRKPKPPDKGAPPEHKPSRKVALEEVMRSLQDLVSNELSIEPVKSPDKAPTTATRKTVPGKKPVTRSTFSADMLPTVPPVAAESDSETAATQSDRAFPEQSASAIPVADNEVSDLGTESLPTPVEPPPNTTSHIPPGGLQQELPYLEVTSSAPSASHNLVEEVVENASLPETLPVVDNAKTGVVADNNAPIATDEEMHWDDFPILEEVVEQAEEIEPDDIGHRASPGNVSTATEKMPSAVQLPPTEAARRLAIQVAARLNVELRKSGQSGLSSDIIARLARLLQEALAKGASNMENNPPDKH